METLVQLLPIIAIFAIFWLLVIRPARKRQQEITRMQDQLGVGDEVITNGGIFGTVASVDGEKVGVEIAPGVVVTLARRAVAGVVRDTAGPAGADVRQDETPDDQA